MKKSKQPKYSGKSFWIGITTMIVIGSVMTAGLLEVARELFPNEKRGIYMIGMIFPMSILMYFTVRLVYSHMNKKIKPLEKALKEVGSGNLDYRLNPKKGAEYSHVYKDFNRMAKELKNTKNEMENFTNAFTHEFKTPIASIGGFAEYLYNNGEGFENEERMEYLKLIMDESGRLSKLSQNTLLLAKLNATEILTNQETYSLTEQLRNVSIIFLKQLDQKNITLNLTFDNDDDYDYDYNDDYDDSNDYYDVGSNDYYDNNSETVIDNNTNSSSTPSNTALNPGTTKSSPTPANTSSNASSENTSSESNSEIMYYGNREIMEQLWINLLNNAIKFTPENGTITVSAEEITDENGISPSNKTNNSITHEKSTMTTKSNNDANNSSETSNTIKVSITDTGVGMDSETIAHIFERYYQSDSTSLIKGNGIGLSIAKRIVDLSEGEILVSSTPGKGSTFTVML